MAAQGEWQGLFSAAFTQSRNPMVMLDSKRRQVEVNGAYLKLLGYSREQLVGKPIYEFVIGGPQDPEIWEEHLAERRFTGTADLLAADGSQVGVQWAATVEIITGHRRVLFVALSTSRAGAHFRRQPSPSDQRLRALSHRERQIIHMVAMGSTGPEIADELRISHNTVRTHVRSAMEKSGARSRAHLVAKALGDGIAFN
ncbi:MAG: LuxR C-terminal-related transcriptional regulator [Solirubrobacteraceae bacterium]